MVENPGLMLPDGSRGPSRFQMVREQRPEYIESVLKSIPLGRTGRAEEAANAVVFLGSSLASYISGVTLNVDGAKSVCL
jgi:3-oxoacyl-[acyl-carrier protein] reductase